MSSLSREQKIKNRKLREPDLAGFEAALLANDRIPAWLKFAGKLDGFTQISA